MEAADQFQIIHHSIVNAMQLTNFSFLNSRMDYLSSLANFKSAAQRISSGSKMEGLRKDVGAYSQGVNARLNKLHNNSYKTNLQNTRSYLEAQEHGLRQVLDIYDRMDVLSIKALDPTTNLNDRNLYDQEFKSLSEQLTEIMNRKFNGDHLYLYSNTVVCGGVKEIGLGELDLATVDSTWDHAIRAQSVEVGAPAGTLSFRVNSGGIGDIYRVWMGDSLVFSLGDPPPAGSSVDHRENYNTYNPNNNLGGGGVDLPDQFSHIQDVPADNPMGDGWSTSSSAAREDDDLIEVTFEPGKPTTYKITPGGTNRDSTDPNKSGL